MSIMAAISCTLSMLYSILYSQCNVYSINVVFYFVFSVHCVLYQCCILFCILSASCTLSMNHDHNGLQHTSERSCEYQKHFDNQDYLCKVSELVTCSGSKLVTC